jgi:hypothetical protein
MTTKKFKTVSGYLRSHDDGLRRTVAKVPEDQFVEAAAVAVRKILNNLLPQIDNLPMLDTDYAPLEGIEQLLKLGGTERQVNALEDCKRWLSKPIHIVTLNSARSAMIPQVKTAQGLISYRVDGYRNDDTGVSVTMIVDAKMGEAHEMAAAIAGPDYCFAVSCNIDHAVPDAAKNKLFFSVEELYAAVPEMRPSSSRGRRSGVSSYRSGGVASAVASTEFYRGYGITEVDGKYVVKKDGETSEQPTEQAAYDWVNTRIEETARKRKTATQPTEPVRRKKPPLTPANWRRQEYANHQG